jgi:hypothetical protein
MDAVMIVVYVAGSYSADSHLAREENILRARLAGMKICRLGAVPIIPHSNTAHFDDVADPEFFYQAGLELVERSDALLMLPFWESSSGSRRERQRALDLQIPVFEDISALEAWLKTKPKALSEHFLHQPSRGTF